MLTHCRLATFLVLTTALPLSAQPYPHGASAYNPSLYADRPAEGDFTRMFPLETFGLTPHPSPIYDLRRLGRAGGPMMESDPVGDSRIEAGLTFLGQFVDHDITLDVTTQLDAAADIDTVRNFRTVDLDLDCVYGDGPEADPWLYDGPLLIEGKDYSTSTDADGHPVARFDLARVSNPKAPNRHTALIGDPRNDENFILSQIQAVFVAFHNTVAREYLAKAAKEAGVLDMTASMRGVEKIPDLAKQRAIEVEAFEAARDHVIHYYHRVLAEYFLPKVIGVGRTVDIATNGRRYYMPEITDAPPSMPVEFSAAAYRYGHSQVRQSYRLRINKDPKNLFTAGSRNGFAPVVFDDAIDFALFFPVPDREAVPYQSTRLLDPHLPEALFNLDQFRVVPPGDLGSLAARNLNRGRTFRLPPGEALFRLVALPRFEAGEIQGQPVEQAPVVGASVSYEGKFGFALTVGSIGLTDWHEIDQTDPTKSAALTEDDLGDFLEANDIVRSTLSLPASPLWYYVLHEASKWEVGFSETPGTQHVWPVANYLPEGVGYLGRDLNVNAEKYSIAPETEAGQVLGPVGGTIVGEVILGLIDHYRETTGKGLDYITSGDEDIRLPKPREFGGFGERMTFGDIIHYIHWHEPPQG